MATDSDVLGHRAYTAHLELSQHPVHGDKTYDDYIGAEALKRKGRKKWANHVRKTIRILESLLHYDVIYLGGGNADKVGGLSSDILIESNQAGITGGIRLWDAGVAQSLFVAAADTDRAPASRSTAG